MSRRVRRETKTGRRERKEMGTEGRGGIGHDFWEGAGLRFEHSARFYSGQPALWAGAISSLARLYGRSGGPVSSACHLFSIWCAALNLGETAHVREGRWTGILCFPRKLRRISAKARWLAKRLNWGGCLILFRTVLKSNKGWRVEKCIARPRALLRRQHGARKWIVRILDPTLCFDCS